MHERERNGLLERRGSVQRRIGLGQEGLRYLVFRQVDNLDDGVGIEELGEGAHAPVRDTVGAEVEVHDGDVVDEATGEHAQLVVVEQGAPEVQHNQRLAEFEAARKRPAVAELDAEEGAVVVHADGAHAVAQRERGEGAAVGFGWPAV